VIEPLAWATGVVRPPLKYIIFLFFSVLLLGVAEPPPGQMRVSNNPHVAQKPALQFFFLIFKKALKLKK
jgi:hypothetical protein